MASHNQKDTQLVATEKEAVASGADLQFSLVIPAEIRMQVSAENEAQAREIVEAMLGDGRWQRDMEIGRPFALRVKWQ